MSKTDFAATLQALKEVGSRLFGNRYYIKVEVVKGHWKATAKKLRVKEDVPT